MRFVVSNEQHIAALRRRLADLEHDMYINDALIAVNPKGATQGDVEVSRWRRAEAEAIHAAIGSLEVGGRREIPLWMYVGLAVMVAVAIALAGMALWTH